MRKTLILCLFLPLLLAGYLLLQAIETSPLMLQATPPSVRDAQQAHNLAKRAQRILDRPQNPPRLSLSEEDFNALARFASRGIAGIAGQVRITPQGLDGIFTLRLPKTPFGEYLNVIFSLSPSAQGVSLGTVTLGKLSVPGPLVLKTAQLAADLALGEQLGTDALAAIDTLSFSDAELVIQFKSTANLAALKKKLRERAKSARDSYALGDREKIQAYYQQLLVMGSYNVGTEPISLARFLAPLFSMAEQRSEQGSAVLENQSALLALAIYLGSEHFQKFTGPLSAAKQASRQNKSNVVLRDRQDLRLHFLISAGLKLLSDSGLGFALGEFKELLDANPGGSGFSFVDLAADRAGLRLAELAVESEDSARRVQRLLAAAQGEEVFFPALQDLEEGIDRSSFESRFGDVQSPAYLALVEDIDRRLAALPLYQQPTLP